VAWLLVAAAVLGCLARTLKPLHASRTAHRQAATWLAATATSPGAVLDTRGWTALYSGRLTYRPEAARVALADPRLAYVVVQRSELELGSRRSQALQQLLAQSAEPTARFRDGSDRSRDVLIYRWHGLSSRQQ
jgi:hypothetical protein